MTTVQEDAVSLIAGCEFLFATTGYFLSKEGVQTAYDFFLKYCNPEEKLRDDVWEEAKKTSSFLFGSSAEPDVRALLVADDEGFKESLGALCQLAQFLDEASKLERRETDEEGASALSREGLIGLLSTQDGLVEEIMMVVSQSSRYRQSS